MRIIKALFPILVCALLLSACDYIVLPEEESSPTSKSSKGWSAIVTNVGASDTGDLRIDITIRNETANWSAMKATADKPAVLTTKDGKSTNCDTVFVGTGGHRLAPGFQMRGYTVGTEAKPVTQLLYVKCKGATATPGSKLSFEYSYVTGELDYYNQDENKVAGKIELNLDNIVKDVKYPIASPVAGLIQKPDTSFTAVSDNVITLLDARRTDTGLEFKWQNFNPTDFPLKPHIGNPPVIGADGILYGIFEIMDIVSVPLTPAKGKVEWTTNVTVPKDVKDFYILLSVESKQMRLYANYAVDITDK